MADSGYIRKTADFGYVQLEWEAVSQDVANNKTSLFYKLYVQRNTSEFSSSTPQAYSIKINGSTVASGTIILLGYGTKTVKTGYVDITHNMDGTKTFSLSFSQAIGVGGYPTMTASGTGTLPTIDRLSTVTITRESTDLGALTVFRVERKSVLFGTTITYKCGAVRGTVCENDMSPTPAFYTPISLASQNTTGTKVSITYTIITTYPAQSQSVGSSTQTLEYTIPTSVGPDLSLEYEDETECFNIFGAYIAGETRLKVKLIADVNDTYGATIASYNTTVNDSKEYTSSEFTIDPLTTTTKLKANITDTRGHYAMLQKYVYAKSYTRPTVAKLTVNRCNEDGTDNDNGSYCRAKFTANATSIIVDEAEKNTVAYTLKYKKSSETEYTEHTFSDLVNVFSVTDQEYIFPADDGSTYDVQLLVVDKLYQVKRTTSLSTATVIFHFGKNGKGVGIGKIDEEADPFEKISKNKGLLDVGFNARFNEDVCGTVAGLGSLPPIHSPADFNDFVQIGCWSVRSRSDGYSNMPVSEPGRLEVISSNGDGISDTGYAYLRQVYTPASAEYPVYERDLMRDNNGEWHVYTDWLPKTISSYNQKSLWSGSLIMNASESITLPCNISSLQNGILLVFRREKNDGSTLKWGVTTHFIPSRLARQYSSGTYYSFLMTTYGFDAVASKYLYIHADTITGHSSNEEKGTGSSGIIYDNSKFVLCEIIGV